MKYMRLDGKHRKTADFCSIFRVFWITVLICSVSFLYAQQLPVKSHISKAETVSFPQTTEFDEALEVLSQLSMTFEGKIIIDPTSQDGPIGIEIPPTYWKKALEYILNSRDLKYAEKQAWYEIQYTSKGEEKAKEIEPEITSKTRTIEISAIFFQGDRRKLRESGINWDVFLDELDINILTFNATSVSQDLFQTAASYATDDGAITVGGLLNAFEALNWGEIITKPKIQVMDGVTGKINIGQRFSIKQKDFAGNTVEQFFEVGSILEVTPEIIQDEFMNFLHLKLKVEKSSAIPDPVSTRIDNQTAETEVLLLNGEQTVIGGLFSEETTVVRKGIPVLKNLPWWVLGIRYLAGFDSKDIQKKELLIFIKADIVPTLSERIEAKRESYQERLDREIKDFNEDIPTSEKEF